MNNLPDLNVTSEKKKITAFLKKTFNDQHIENAVIGLSGGIDSTVSFSLLKEVLPAENIFIAHLYYDKSVLGDVERMIHQSAIPDKNRHIVSIKPLVDEITTALKISKEEKLRKGNIAARMRMIILFDLAKKYNALVVGTENKTENMLGYFTRFGDQASDIEPIEHLYKTHVYQLAKSLRIPESIITQHPTAGLWQGQTDEGEFGFSYQEADTVLYLAFEKKLPVEKILKMGYVHSEKILAWRERNLFKHEVPYTL